MLQQQCVEDAEEWLGLNVATNTVDSDFGLARIATNFGKSDAVKAYWEGAAKEEIGDIDGAILLYRLAFRMWPALDSIIDGGLPRGVREEAEAAGLSIIMHPVSVPAARHTKVVLSPSLLNSSDMEIIDAVWKRVNAFNATSENNPENARHDCKVCTFLNDPPICAMWNQAPQILYKMIHFASEAWEQQRWSGSRDEPGPLFTIVGGFPSLSIRVVERWEYDIGGGLVDPLHYDVDSVLTIVALLSSASEFDGGVFRTHEPDGIQLEHPMDQGDVICFISHKFHNVTPVTRGQRRSLVIEMWEGGVGHMGR